LLAAMPAGAQVVAGPLEERVRRVAEEASRAFVYLGGGSGFLISEDGYVLTNHHVAEQIKTDRPTVMLCDGRSMHARKVATDAQGDVTLLKLEPEAREKFAYLEWGDSDALESGAYVVAIGNPFGSGTVGSPGAPRRYPTVTVGIVSALHRNQAPYYDAVQTDASLNPGNSGGPLLTLEGKWVGINGRIATRFGNRFNSGVGFAISSAQIRRFLPRMKEGDPDGGVLKIRHGVIRGLKIGSPVSIEGRGVMVREVDEGGAAAEAGFRKGDVVVEVGGYPTLTPARYRGVVGSFPADAEVLVKLLRDGAPVELKIVLEGEGQIRPPKNPGWTGVRVTDAAGGGVEVTDVTPDSPADKAGLKVGDVIVKVGIRRVESVDEYLQRLWRHRAGDAVTLRVRRGGEEQDVSVTLAPAPP
jgi:S1-C subfamily serine protease